LRRAIHKPRGDLVLLVWALMVAALLAASTLSASADPTRIDCTLLVDAGSSKPLLREGACDHRASPGLNLQGAARRHGFR